MLAIALTAVIGAAVMGFSPAAARGGARAGSDVEELWRAYPLEQTPTTGAPPERHTGFAKTVLRFDTKGGRWAAAGELPAPCVTTPCVRWDAAWVVPSGEIRPGVRSPEVWRWVPETK